MSPEQVAADQAARTVALTRIDRNVLVEAGAGSGKTSVLAGRVVSLLAAGVAPDAVAAISFTVFSASELRERIVHFVDEVVARRMPPDLAGAFPAGAASDQQRARLATAKSSLDRLTCTTIHGFCSVLLRPFPVESGLDPGATMLEEQGSELVFSDTYETWLRERMAGPYDPNDGFARLFAANPGAMTKLVVDLAEGMRRYPGAGVCPCETLPDVLPPFSRAVAAFRAFVDRCAGRCPDRVREALEAFEAHLAEASEAEGEAAMLEWLAALSEPERIATASGFVSATRGISTKKAWQGIHGGGKATVAVVDQHAREAAEAYQACCDAHEALRDALVPRVLHLACMEVRDLLDRFARAKRDAAVLDFDDLIAGTRDLLRKRHDVRRDLATRFTAVLVDEFQDTDPAQVEILWRLCGDPPDGRPDAPWRDWPLRPGALFLVGDAKQAIYRFRGADVAGFLETMERLRAAEDAEVVTVSRNFRSRPQILDWVNDTFVRRFSAEGQAPYANLSTDLSDPLRSSGVVRLAVPVGEGGNADADADVVRAAEAEAVARLCADLVGTHQVRDRLSPGGVRVCEPRDIALLTPGGTGIWRYERELEEVGLTVAAQAGKGFYRRQEVQDLIALTRTLADRRDRLALGALLRGPLVGMTDEQLLDAVADQPPGESGRPAPLSLDMDVSLVGDPLLADTLRAIAALASRRHDLSPHALLCQAVERLDVRAKLRERGGRVAERALANLDLFLETSRAYDLRGLQTFANHVRTQWQEATKGVDGRPDADRDSISLVTMHSSKGLEWPVVIAVNCHGDVKDRASVAYDKVGELLHLPFLKRQSSEGAEAQRREKDQRTFERERLWYVAATRARDTLVLPCLEPSSARACWMSLIPILTHDLPGLERPDQPAPISPRHEPPNLQDAAAFAAEADVIVAATPRIRRLTPSLAEDGPQAEPDTVVRDSEPAEPARGSVRGGLARGLVLHKLMEEVLSGELDDRPEAVEARALVLARELRATADLDPSELADCVRRGFAAPEVAAVRTRLRAEWPVARAYAETDGAEAVVSGVADAVAISDDGGISLVVDWKSDVDPTSKTVEGYRGQLAAYLSALGAPTGLLVFLTSGVTVRVAVAR